MLAMDVVDTLRHADKLVERELSSDERDRQLKERLRQIYAAQGLDLPDRALDEGVAALREKRFVYRPPRPSLDRTLAVLWVRRRRWGGRLLIGLALLLLVLAAYEFGVRRPEQQRVARVERELSEGLPGAMQRELSRVESIARDPAAVRLAKDLIAQGQAAAKAGDLEGARARVRELEALRARLAQAYSVRIVSSASEPSGIIRTPDINPDARNYYLVVEAVDANGRPLKVPVTSEEEGRTATVGKWAIRVDGTTYRRVRADKQDDGIIQNNIVGTKASGNLDVDYSVPRPGGAILKW